MLPMHLWGPSALKIQCLASKDGPDGLSAAAAPHPLSLPKGILGDGDNFTRCQKPSLFCVHRVSILLSKPALTSAFVLRPLLRLSVLTQAARENSDSNTVSAGEKSKRELDFLVDFQAFSFLMINKQQFGDL